MREGGFSSYLIIRSESRQCQLLVTVVKTSRPHSSTAALLRRLVRLGRCLPTFRCGEFCYDRYNVDKRRLAFLPGSVRVGRAALAAVRVESVLYGDGSVLLASRKWFPCLSGR